MKKIAWIGSSLKDLSDFPKDARSDAGHNLLSVQKGEDPSDWKPMSAIGAGVKEIRIHSRNEYRVIYVAKFSDAIYVLHAFMKKTQKTTQKDIQIAKNRYEVLIRELNDEKNNLQRTCNKRERI